VVAERDPNKRLLDYQTRKSVHINLVKSTHAGLRILLFKKGLSMQEVFNRLASLICEEHPALMKIINTIEVDKRNRQIKQVTKSDSESIFDLIEHASPFDSDEED